MEKPFSIESAERPNFNVILDAALRSAYKVHNDLGESGETMVEKNQFGETALRVDVESEEAILNVLREMKVPIRIISEEHGLVDIVEKPIYLGVLDGLDGSNRYQAGRGTEWYGTMFGIFSNTDPAYGEYLVSGIMEHTTGKRFTAEKGKGSFVTTEDGVKTPVRVSGREDLNAETRIYVNQYWENCRRLFSEKFKGLHFTDPRAYATYFSDLASGDVDLVISSTGKNNLELAIGFGLISEAGGTVVDQEGESIVHKKFLEFGQKELVPVVAATNATLAQKLIRHVA